MFIQSWKGNLVSLMGLYDFIHLLNYLYQNFAVMLRLFFIKNYVVKIIAGMSKEKKYLRTRSFHSFDQKIEILGVINRNLEI